MKGFWNAIMWWVPTPYRVMRWYGKAQDTLHDFHLTHSNTAFAVLIGNIVIAAIAFKADWDVLYGIEFSSTVNSNGSWWQATIFASLIQLMLLFCGNKIFQLWLNDVHHIGEHYTQFKVNLALFCIGLSSTLFLSYQSDYSAKGKSLMAQEQNRINHNNALDSLEVEKEAAIYKLEKQFITDSTRTVGIYGSNLDNLAADLKIIVDKKIEENKLSRAKDYELEYSKKEQKIADSIRTALAPLHLAHKQSLSELKRDYKRKQEHIDTHFQNEYLRLGSDGQFNGIVTRWKNIVLNVISLILSMLIQTFVRGSNTQFGGGTAALTSIPNRPAKRARNYQAPRKGFFAGAWEWLAGSEEDDNVAATIPIKPIKGKMPNINQVPPKVEALEFDGYSDEDLKRMADNLQREIDAATEQAVKGKHKKYSFRHKSTTGEDETTTHKKDSTTVYEQNTTVPTEMPNRTVVNRNDVVVNNNDELDFDFSDNDSDLYEDPAQQEATNLQDIQKGAGAEEEYRAPRKDNKLDIRLIPYSGEIPLIRSNGGTLDANTETFYRINNGQIETLYYGAGRNAWRDKVWHNAQIGNRMGKMKNSLGQEAKRNNALWAHLHETLAEKIAELEAIELKKGGK